MAYNCNEEKKNSITYSLKLFSMSLTCFSMYSAYQSNISQGCLCKYFLKAFLRRRRRETGEMLGDATQQVAAGSLRWR